MAFRSYIESIAFQPPTPAAYSERDPRLSWVPLRADGPDGPRIPVYFARAPGRSLTDASQAVTIVYSHGNAEDLGQLMPLMDELALALGVNVCAYDYVGYGPVRSTKPSESGNYRSVEAAVRWLETVRRIPISNIVLYGRSLGGGAAVHAAITFPKVRGLVLQSTFTSAARVVVDLSVFDWVLGDIFINQNKLGRVACPVGFVHGQRDEVIDWHHTERLAMLPKQKLEPLFLADAGHNDIEAFHMDKLAAYLRTFLLNIK
eukprot:Unigene11299_Nuclearia_a/m.34519 Unigene11299_Nuclearia_a/g.34519  ORF Unigene11299_Nuclearia_a/g.34519 Unigene11299_Nuclearia_a/m.34519 type:complete len:260 (+) Unigene11299_Nuclearia_a:14-793(+)